MLNKLPKLLYGIIIILLAGQNLHGQTITQPDDKIKTDDKDKGPKATVKFGFNYSSNNVFMGRTDSVATPTITPEVKYTLKSGIYVSGSVYYVTNKKTNKLDGGELSIGYNMDITEDLSASASYTKQFYSASSTEITSSINDVFEASFDYDMGDIVSPTLNTDYILNKKGLSNEFYAGLALAHDFITKGVFGTKDFLLISPTITMNTGTQDGGNFNVLDYELSMPFIYKTGHLYFLLSPTYSIAENQQADLGAVTPAIKNSVFYFEAGVFMRF